MASDDFAAEIDRLWLQVKPLYDALHAFTRNGLERAYGARGAAPDGRIPAHLRGNMWSRDGLEAGHLYVAANGHASVGLREIRVRPVPNRNCSQPSLVGPRPGASRGDRGVRFSLSMLRRSRSAPGSSPA
jgi:hypothetical protein